LACLSPAQFDGFQAATKEMVKNKKGTTTLAFIFDKGVIVAADSRASMGGYICELPAYFADSRCWDRLGFSGGVESVVWMRNLCRKILDLCVEFEGFVSPIRAA